MHDHLRTVLAAPMTSAGRSAGFRVTVKFQGKEGLIVIDQMRALDKRRCVRRMGALAPQTLRAALAVLREVFAD